MECSGLKTSASHVRRNAPFRRYVTSKAFYPLSIKLLFHFQNPKPFFTPSPANSPRWVSFHGGKANLRHPIPLPSRRSLLPRISLSLPKSPAWMAPSKSPDQLPPSPSLSSALSPLPPIRSLSPVTALSQTTSSPAAGRLCRQAAPMRLFFASSSEDAWECKLNSKFINDYSSRESFVNYDFVEETLDFSFRI